MPRTIRHLVSEDGAKLSAALALDASDARLEAQYLLQHALNKPRAWLLAHAEAIPEPAQLAAYEAALQRRLHGEPVAYILGEREFYGLNFRVTPATLIPRPETELLVEQALQHIPPSLPCRVLDLGTGSGAIALSVAQHRPKAEVVAVDASPEALQVARENAARLNIGNVSFLLGDWYAPLGGQRFDLIVSNPPYIAADDAHLKQGDLRFEPASALAAGADGLDDIRRIVAGAGAHLMPGGWIMMEHGHDQAARVCELLRAAGFSMATTATDLAGIGRVSGGQLN